jgi:transcriptional regulator with XRE-family HTH domain
MPVPDKPDPAGDPTLAAAATAWFEKSELSVTDLHKRTGMSRQTIYRVLDGLPTGAETLRRFATELGATAGALIDGIMPAEEAKPRSGHPAIRAEPDAELQQEVGELEKDFALLAAVVGEIVEHVGLRSDVVRRWLANKRRGIGE